MVDGVGEKPDTLSTLSCGANVRGAWCVVVVALVIDSCAAIDVCPFPARISFNRHTRRPNHLIFGQVERNVVGREFTVELAGRIQRVILPAVFVVHDDFGIPLREVEATASTSLAARQGRGPSLPIDVCDERIARGKRPREGPMRDRRVGRMGVIRFPRHAHHRRCRNPLERVIGVFQVLEALALFGGVDGSPA